MLGTKDLLATPLPTVLAAPGKDIPDRDGLPGGARYEPKFDGIRVTAARREGSVTLWSRHGTDLTAAFPELAAAAETLAPGTVVDGELVAWVDGKLNFDVLLQRMNAGRQRATMMARKYPTSLVLFDVLVVHGTDVRDRPFDERRAILQALADGWRPPLALSPSTVSQEIAADWFESMADAGVEGLVVKGGAQTYRGGERIWVKVKRRETVDVVIGAVTGPRDRPRELVVGDVVDGELRIVGRTAPLTAEKSRQVGKLLRVPDGPHPWPEVISSGTMNRFGAKGSTRVTLVEPVIGEVLPDSARIGGSFRHSVRFVRLRPDIT